ncbi:MAG: DnaA/Hda family protein [Planctomycetes bacterium]|nr:DnaA/Hda family protein [Planctomycetota bacterium]
MSLVDEVLLAEIRAQLSQRIPEPYYTRWFLRFGFDILSQENERLVLGTPNRFFKERIEQYLQLINEVAELVIGRPVKVEIAISPRLFMLFKKSSEQDREEAEKLRLPSEAPVAGSTAAMARRSGSVNDSDWPRSMELNPDFTFANFVVGRSNRLSHAVALRAVDPPGADNYNRIYFCGQHGVGKTHLIQAVCHAALESKPEARVIYVTGDRFENDFTTAFISKRMKEFRAFYRGADLLAFDELQALGVGNKRATQAELLGIVDELYSGNKQVLFSATHAPAELDGVDAKLQDRLGAGFVDKIALPDEKTRRDIIERKMTDRHIDLPKAAVKLMAQELTGNVRQLEGALSRLAALIEIEGMEPTLSCIRMALEVSTPATRKSALTFSDIIQAVAEEFGATPEALTGRGRALPLKKARQLAVVLCRRLVGGRYAELGEAFGGRSHATVISLVKNPPVELFSSGLSGRPLERILFRLGVNVKPEDILERQKGLFDG